MCQMAHPVFIRNEILMQYDNVHKCLSQIITLLVVNGLLKSYSREINHAGDREDSFCV